MGTPHRDKAVEHAAVALLETRLCELGQPTGDGLPLRQREREAAALTRRRGDPARSRDLIPHDLGDPAQRAADGIQ